MPKRLRSSARSRSGSNVVAWAERTGRDDVAARAPDQQRVAVRIGLGDFGCADQRSSAGLVLDDDGAEVGLDPLGPQPADDVVHAGRRRWRDQPDGPVRIVRLGCRILRDDGKCGGQNAGGRVTDPLTCHFDTSHANDVSRLQRPRNTGRRFSRNARRPSCAWRMPDCRTRSSQRDFRTSVRRQACVALMPPNWRPVASRTRRVRHLRLPGTA